MKMSFGTNLSTGTLTHPRWLLGVMDGGGALGCDNCVTDVEEEERVDELHSFGFFPPLVGFWPWPWCWTQLASQISIRIPFPPANKYTCYP